MNRSIRHARGRTLTAFLATVMMVVGLLSVSMATAQADGSGVIRGKVTRAGGVGLVGIDVTVYREVTVRGETHWESNQDAITVSGGTYSVTGLSSGNYRLEFDDFASGDFVGEYYGNKDYIDDATDIVVQEGVPAIDKNAELARAGHITGRVTKAVGVGLADIDVTAYELVDQGDGESSWEEFSSARTESDGTYDVGGLATGAYRLGFDDSEHGNHLSEYYNNKALVEDAANVSVTAGATAPGKDAELAAAGHITGKVTSPSGSGYEGVEVSAYQVVDNAQGADWEPVATYETGSDGYYSLDALPGGTYRLGFSEGDPEGGPMDEYFNNKPTIEDAEDIVVVAGATVADKNAQLAYPSHIAGRVTKAGGEGIAHIAVAVYALVDGSWDEIDGAYTSEYGYYSVRGLRGGTYRVGFVDDDNGNYATEYYDNKASIDSATDVVVPESATVANIDAELDDGSHITGKVTNPGGTGIADVAVVAYSLQPDGEGGNSWQEATFASTEGDGAYDMGGLPGGTYRLGFEDLENEVYKTEYFDDKPSVDDAVDIVVTTGATVADTNAELAVDLPRVTNTARPTISGTPVVGQTLTAKPGTWTPTGATFTYQWLADDTEISGASATTYKLVAGDAGKKISIEVTGAKGGYNTGAEASVETTRVSALLTTPKNHRSTAQTSSSLTLAWDAVPGAPKYRVQFSKSSNMSSPTYLPFDTNGGKVNGLAAKTKHYFKVSVVGENNSARLTPYTATAASASTKPYEFSTPGGLKSTAKSSTSLTLGWNAVAGASAYRVQMSKSSSMSSPVYVAFDSNSGKVAGLAPNTRYYFKISVTDADHATRMSAYTATPANATTKMYDFAAPTYLNCVDRSSNSLKLDLEPVMGAGAYRIQISKYADMSKGFYRALPLDGGVVTGLAANTKYYLRVALANTNDTARLSDYSAKPALSAKTLVATP